MMQHYLIIAAAVAIYALAVYGCRYLYLLKKRGAGVLFEQTKFRLLYMAIAAALCGSAWAIVGEIAGTMDIDMQRSAVVLIVAALPSAVLYSMRRRKAGRAV